MVIKVNGRRLIIGDVHGRYQALRQVLGRAGYDDEIDTLYSVGDFCDRGRDNLEVLEYLSSLRNFRPVLGNHDAWLQDYLRTGFVLSDNWYSNNGGYMTVASFNGVSRTVKKRLSLWLDGIPYSRKEEGIVLLHGGPVGRSLARIMRPRDYEREREADDIPDELWDRTYLRTAVLYEHWLDSDEKKAGLEFSRYKEVMQRHFPGLGKRTRDGELYIALQSGMIYTGHSVVGDRPFTSETFHITAIDTGAASKSGRLTCMNIDSGEYWQSDRIDETEEEY